MMFYHKQMSPDNLFYITAKLLCYVLPRGRAFQKQHRSSYSIDAIVIVIAIITGKVNTRYTRVLHW